MLIPRFASLALLAISLALAQGSNPTWVATVTYYTDSACVQEATTMSGGARGRDTTNANVYSLEGADESGTSACAAWNADPAVLYVASSASKTNLCVTFFSNAACSGSGVAFHLYDYGTCYQDKNGDLSDIANYYVKVTLSDTSVDNLPDSEISQCEPPIWAVSVSYFSDNACTVPSTSLPGGLPGFSSANTYSMTAIDSEVSACSAWNIIGSLYVKATAGKNEVCVVYHKTNQCTGTVLAHHLYSYGDCYQDTEGDGSHVAGYFVKATLRANADGQDNLPSTISTCSSTASLRPSVATSLALSVVLAVLGMSWF